MNNMENQDKREIFQNQFAESITNIFKGGLISAALIGSTALTYSTISPYMNDFYDIGGILNGLGSIINGTNPICNELLKNTFALNIVSKSISQVLKQKDFYKFKGQSMIYSLAGKIYDKNPEKYQNIKIKETMPKESIKKQSTLERLEKLPAFKADVIKQARTLLADNERGQNCIEVLTNGIFSISDSNVYLSRIISDKLEEQGFELNGKRGKDAILHLIKNPLSIQSEEDKKIYLDFASDYSKLKSIYTQENDTTTFSKFLKRFSSIGKKNKIEDKYTQMIRGIMRGKIVEFSKIR